MRLTRRGVPDKRGISPAARAALAAKRATMQPGDMRRYSDAAEVFVVRGQNERSFAWELRRHGGVVLLRAERAYATVDEARAAGELALREHGEGS